MPLRLILFFFLLTSVLSAQRIVPLMEHSRLRGPAASMALAVNCDTLPPPGVQLVRTGVAGTTRVELDTVGLGSDLDDYRCIGCDDLRFGAIDIRTDTITYRANAGVEQGLDTVGFTVCSPGGVCADTVELIFLVQRPGRTVQLGEALLDPQQEIDVMLPPAELPGTDFCYSVASCGSDYAGRGQEFYLVDEETLRYRAARYGGRDVVCVTVCNNFGLCDTYEADFFVSRPTTSLPFFDDFSYAGNRPAADLWQDEDVLINRTYAEEPPSIGVATFDAVNFDGLPYTALGSSRRTAPRDFLTSAPVALAGQAGTVLSFYLQPRGLGNRPEVQDSFLVQFLDPTGNWNTVFAREGLDITVGLTEAVPFEGYTVDVPPVYLYNGFQFRFVNLGSERGAVDTWHLDYVKLSNTSTTLITQDLALTEPPFRLLAPYTSLPARHLAAAPDENIVDSVFLAVRNHRADVTPVTGSRFRIERVAGPGPSVGGSLLPSPYFGQDNAIAPQAQERRTASFGELPGSGELRQFLAGLDPAQDYVFRTTYELEVATEDVGFAPGIAANSSASQLTYVDDYMAYDDGTAEVAIEGEGGLVIVQRYTAYVADELLGLRVRLPRGLSDNRGQNINLVVYADNGAGRPGELLLESSQPVLYAEDFYGDSLQAFTSYALDEPLPLPEGNFYVGWRQVGSERPLAVGFDRNNQPDSVQFFRGQGDWEVLRGATRGAIMLRPLLAGEDVMPTSIQDYRTTTLRVYPNPVRGDDVLHLAGEGCNGQLSYRLLDLSGRELLRGRGCDAIRTAILEPGGYLLEVTTNQGREVYKIIRAH